ncbi:MAG: site-2 protease family protein [Thermoproteota archaeon]|nr:site-2 protease family protein [Thermoproteota archaeon]
MATIFLNSNYSRVVSIVSSFFIIRDTQLNIRENYIEFLVANADIKDKFPLLLKELGKVGMVATARRQKYFSRLMPALSSTIRFQIGEGGIVITVFSAPKQKIIPKRKLHLPLLFFALAVAFVFYDGLMRSGTTFAKTYVSDPVLLAIAYTMSLMGILGIHELGHMIALKHYDIKASWPYFIPGIPGLIPTFGALITQQSRMPTKNVMFDVGIAGPIAGLIITIIVSIYGSALSTLIPLEEYMRLSEQNQLFTFHTGLLMMATLHMTGKIVENTVLVMSPLLFAAWIGFALTAVNLVPAWQLDGGHLARAMFGERWHRIITYAGIGVLFIMGFWPMAILVLIFSQRVPSNTPLDDVTPLSPKRKILFFIALGLAVVSAPIPSSILPWA